MRKLVINIAALAAIISGFWVAGMVGNPELDASTATLGSLIAIALGFFAAIGIAAIWGDWADDLDFKDRLVRARVGDSDLGWLSVSITVLAPA